MIGACEVLSFIAIITAGSNTIKEDCAPTMEACTQIWREIIKDPNITALQSCSPVDDWVRRRDAGRENDGAPK